MADLQDIQRFWRERVGPQGYSKPMERSLMLAQRLRGLRVRRPTICELGCNCGRNLWMLWKENVSHRLTGVEISPRAKMLYYELFSEACVDFYCMPIEEWILGEDDDSHDIVFTMATLLHIHPDSEWIFPHIARITRRFLVLVENEQSAALNENEHQYHFPRNYREVFEPLGMRQVLEENGFADLKVYKLRIFEKLCLAS